jgi:hypothetical protein
MKLGGINRTMKHALLIAAVILMPSLSNAQGQRGGRAMERIHAAKIAYITDRLQLTTKQSSVFIPLYNEYEQDLRKSRREFLGKYKGMQIEDADDQTAKHYIDDNLDYQQRVIDLKRKYNPRFLDCISEQQLSQLNEAERDFRKLLQERLKERRQRINR